MKDYIPLNNNLPSKLKMSLKLLTGITAVFFGIRVHSLMSVIAGNLIMVSGLLRKWVWVNRGGLFTLYDAYFFSYEEVWSFNEITSIHRDLKRCGNGEVRLHFGKDAVCRQYIFETEVARKIILMAKEKNPDLTVGDV